MTKARDLGDNAQNTKPKVVNAKADLIVGTGSDAADRLAVGSNGDTLVADSSATTGLRWQGNFAAGKNKIINGDFGIWQRGTSFTYTAGAFLYTADRFNIWHNGSTAGTNTASQQTFTPGTAPVAGYEGQFFHRITTTTLGTGQTVIDLNQFIEDVRTFAGQTVAVSFWAKSSGTQGVSGFLSQDFGSGGSSRVDNSLSISGNLSSSWQRFSAIVTLPSISGKTIGTGSHLRLILRVASPTAGQTIDVWGVQVEAGNVATAFQTATGTLAGELAACKYYYQIRETTSSGSWAIGQAYSGTAVLSSIQLDGQMRTNPTIVMGAAGKNAGQSSFLTSSATFPGTVGTTVTVVGFSKLGFEITASGYGASTFTAGDASMMYANGAQTVFTASAEL